MLMILQKEWDLKLIRNSTYIKKRESFNFLFFYANYF